MSYPPYGQGPYPPQDPQYGAPQYRPPYPPRFPQQAPPPYGPPQFGHQAQGIGHGTPGMYPMQQYRVSSVVNALGWVLLGFGLLVVVSAFLPWVVVGERAFNGVGKAAQLSPDGTREVADGLATAGIAGVVALLGLLRGVTSTRSAVHAWSAVCAVLGGISVAIFGFKDLGRINDAIERLGSMSSGIDVEVGIGLYGTAFGGLALVVIGVVAGSKTI